MTTLESAGADQDLWHVEVGPDDVRVVTLDQLDQAFQDGLVTDSTRVWQEGMACAVSLAELLGGDDDEPASEQEPEYSQHEYAQAHYAEPQYAAPQYAEPQYAHQQYTEPRYAAPQYAQQQYSQPQYVQQHYSQAEYPQQQYAPPQYLPPKSAPPPSRAGESSWPPVIARSETPPPVSTAPPSMAPMALDVPDFDIQYPRSGGKGKFLLAAFVLAAIGGVVAVQKNGGFASMTSTPVAAATQAPTPPPAPTSHAYDPGPPVKLGESKPPVTLTVREPEEKKVDDKKADPKADDKKLDAKKVMASGKKPKAAPRTRHAASGGSKPAGSGFKLGKSGSKYDPLNGSL